METEVRPARPSITIAGAVSFIYIPNISVYALLIQACEKKSERDFHFDIVQWAFDKKRVAAHTCHFPENNRRFAEKVPMPRQGGTVCIMGPICRRAITTFGDETIKRVPVEVMELSFLSSDSVTSSSSPVKGPFLNVSFSTLFTIHRLPGKTSRFAWAQSSGKGKQKEVDYVDEDDHDDDDDTLGSNGPTPKKRKRKRTT
jgi:hypothetical protein